MLRKTLIATTLLAATSTIALANGAPYVGASIGVNNTDATVSTNNTTAFGNSSSSSTMGARGALMNVFAGYGATVNQNIYLGGEVFAGAANSESSLNKNYTAASGLVNNSSTSLRTKYSVGADFIPGVKVSEHTMVYGRVGIVDTRFDAHGSNVNTFAGTSSSFSQSNNRVGGRLGLGMQTSLTQNWDVRAEYVYTGYRSYKVMNSNVKPSTDQYTVGLVYKFD